MTNSIQREGLSIQEACEVAGVGRTRLYAAIAAGDLLARKFGKRRIVLRSDLRRFLKIFPPADDNRLPRTAGRPPGVFIATFWKDRTMTHTKAKRHRIPRALEVDSSSQIIGDLPVVIAQWSRNARDTVMVRIDQFNGTMVVDIREWWMSPSGELKPGPKGITMSVRHLPSLARALTKADAAARQLGLLAETDDA